MHITSKANVPKTLMIHKQTILNDRLLYLTSSDSQVHIGIIWQGSLKVNPSVLIVFFSWLGFSQTVYDRFHGNGNKLSIFRFRKPANSKQAWLRVPLINYLLT